MNSIKECQVGNFSKSVANSYTGFHVCAGISFTGITQFQWGKLIQSPAFLCTNTRLLCMAVQGPHTILALQKASEKKDKERRLSDFSSTTYLETVVFFFFFLVAS